MNHQQATIAYIAGLMEGEGSFIITRHIYKKRFNYRSSIFLTNTDPDIIKTFLDFLKSIGINSWIHSEDRRKKNRKICYQVIIKKLKDKILLAKTLLPQMHSKTKIRLAKIVLDFSQYRIEENKKPLIRDEKGKLISGGHANQGERDEQFYEAYKEVMESSETIRRTLIRFSDDIAQTLTEG